MQRIQCGLTLILATFTLGGAEPYLKVDHAFAQHQQRLTLGQPEGSHQIIVDLWEPGLVLRWTDKSLADPDVNAFGGWSAVANPANSLYVQPEFPRGWRRVKVHRMDGTLPVVVMRYEGPEGTLDIEALDGVEAGIVKITLTPRAGGDVRLLVDVFTESAVAAEGALFRLDNRIHCFLAEPMPPWKGSFKLAALGNADLSAIRLIRGKLPDRRDFMRTIGIDLSAKKTPQRVWVVIPHTANSEDLQKLRLRNWAREWEKAVGQWRNLLARAPRFTAGDPTATEAYYAALADNFLLREPVGDGLIGVTAGTAGFRSVPPMGGQTLANVVSLLRAGFNDQAWSAVETYLKLQDPSGRLDRIRGSLWHDGMYWVHGNFGLAMQEYYRFTGDRAQLQRAWPHMVRLARWAGSERKKSKSLGADHPYYGLMPPGKGDGGLSNDFRITGARGIAESRTHPYDYFVYYPHNIWNLIGLKCIRDLAKDFGSAEEQAEINAEFDDAWQCLKRSLDKRAEPAGAGLWIPATPEHDSGSYWSRLQVAYPGELVPLDHPWVVGALSRMEGDHGEFGLPRYMGWATLGVWPGGVIEQPGPVYLRRGDVDKLTSTFYAILNIATPVWTWSSDRQGGSDTLLSDVRGLQESFPTVFFTWLFRDLFVYEAAKTLHLAGGIPRHWYQSGKALGASNAPSWFGPVTYEIRADAARKTVRVRGSLPGAPGLERVNVHLNLPKTWKVARLARSNRPGARLDGESVLVPAGAGGFDLTVALR